jgi:hypothetical protein
MITTLKAGSTFHVTGDTPQSIQEDLDFAVELARAHAMKGGRHGILVARLGTGSFTLTLSAGVPYGTSSGILPDRDRAALTKSQKTEWMKAKAIPEGSHVHLLSHGRHIGQRRH